MAGRNRRYTDEYRASAVLMWEANPNFVQVANHLKMPESTLRSWVNRHLALEKQPNRSDLDAKVYDNKKIDFVKMIDSLLVSHLTEANVTLPGASHHEVIGGVKVLFDVKQLLTGGPTENINQRVMVLDFGDAPNGNDNERTLQD